jgi:hypothetical protein
MCLTDATGLIPYDPKDKKQIKALNGLKKKMLIRKRFMEGKIADINRALKRVDQTLKRAR